MEYWKSYRYKHITFLLISLILAFFIFRIEAIHDVLLHLGSFGYISIFLAGMFFVSTYTVATAAVILLVLAEKYTAIEIGILAGAGAVVGDLITYKIVKDTIIEEVTPIYNRLGGKHLTSLLYTRYFRWTLPVIGALIIASPFPDEIGVSLMGIARMNTRTFILISFLLNAVGIMLLISASTVIKP